MIRVTIDRVGRRIEMISRCHMSIDQRHFRQRLVTPPTICCVRRTNTCSSPRSCSSAACCSSPSLVAAPAAGEDSASPAPPCGSKPLRAVERLYGAPEMQTRRAVLHRWRHRSHLAGLGCLSDGNRAAASDSSQRSDKVSGERSFASDSPIEAPPCTLLETSPPPLCTLPPGSSDELTGGANANAAAAASPAARFPVPRPACTCDGISLVAASRASQAASIH